MKNAKKGLSALIITAISATSLCFGMNTFSAEADTVTASGSDAVSGAGSGYESALFDTESIMTVDILMDEDKWQDFLDNAASEQYCRCDVVINGETFRNVGIRAKGNTSLSNIARDDTTDRYSLKIKFDKYVEGQTCHGLDKLVLNNNYADATCMKEAVVYDMFAYLSADASLYNYSKLCVNGEYFGLYLAFEAVKDSFLMRNYGTYEGKLYKPENMDGSSRPSGQNRELREDPAGRGGNPPQAPDEGNQSTQVPDEENRSQQIPDEGNRPDEGLMDKGQNGPGAGVKTRGPGGSGEGGSNLEYSDDDLDSYETIWEGAVNDSSAADHRRVVDALKAISEGDLSTIEEYMDVDNILKYMAVHEFVVNDDSLSGNMAHNYYLYEHGGQVNIIPWDYNLAFGGMGGNNPGLPQSSDNADRADQVKGSGATSVVNDPIDDSWGSTSFFDVLLDNEEYNSRYHEYLQMLVDYVEGGRYEEVTKEIRSGIDELVRTDPTAFYTYEEYENACKVLDEVVDLRAQSIKGQLDGTIPSTSAGQREDSSSLIDASHINTSDMGTMKLNDFRSPVMI